MIAWLIGAALAASPSTTVVVLDLEAGHGVEADLARSVSEAELLSVRRVAPGKVLGSADLKAMMGMEKQKELLGCKQDTACILEIGAALGAGELVTGSLSRLGETFLLVMRRVDPAHASVLKEGSRTRSTAQEAALIDDLGSLAYELYAPAPPAPSPASVPPGTSPRSLAAPAPPPTASTSPSRPNGPALGQSAVHASPQLPPPFPGEAVDATLHRKACEGGSGLGCNKLGILYGTGRGLPHDDTQAAALYRRACELGEPHGCHNVGVALEHGRGLPPDAAQAASYYQKACIGGDPKGCAAAARLTRHP